jgi:hypothetical protein
MDEELQGGLNSITQPQPVEVPVDQEPSKESLYKDNMSERLRKERLIYDQHLQKMINALGARENRPTLDRELAAFAGEVSDSPFFASGFGKGVAKMADVRSLDDQRKLEEQKAKAELLGLKVGQTEKDYALEKELKSQQMLEDFIARKRLPQTQGGQSGVALDTYLDLAKSGDVEITPQDIVMFSRYDKDKAALLEKLYDNQIKAKEVGQKQFGKTSRFLPVLNEVSENLTLTQNEQIERMINKNATNEEFLSYYENQGIIPRRAVKQKPTAISATDEVTEAPEKIEGPASRQRRLETEKVITEKSADTKLKIQQKDIDTITEDAKVAGDLKIVGKQMYDIANNPATQSMFGKLANTKYSSLFLKALQEPVRIGNISVGVGNIEELAVMAGGNQDEINALKQFVKPAAEAELAFTRIFLSKQGQVTEGERTIVRKIIAQVGDPFSVVKAKSELMIARSQFEEQKAQLFNNYINKNTLGTMNDFMQSPQYKNLFSGYEKHTADIANSYLPNSVKAPSGKKSTTSSGLWESIQRAKEPQ